VTGGIDTVIPVSAYIPGCPASPAAILDGVVKLLSSLDAKAPAAAPPTDDAGGEEPVVPGDDASPAKSEPVAPAGRSQP
jgi:NADH:ubiquinone oxidoreductase subunit B-like Fe-S oxidoreductase